VGSHSGICQCECLDAAAGAPGRPGELQCTLGIASAIERAAPCDAADVEILLGTLCIPLTTARVSASIVHANFDPQGCRGGNPCAIPVAGPVANDGNPLSCARYDSGTLSGLGLVGTASTFGTLLGDVLSELLVRCQ
jgi:hypothetical protein